MKVIDHLSEATETLVSFEIIPPKRGGKLENLLAVVKDLTKYKPPFIDVTSHAAEADYEETSQGLQRRVKRKRPGTAAICVLIQEHYKVDAVMHLLCNGFTREETEDLAIELQYFGIENVLALRGDEPNYKKPVQEGKTINHHAVDLVKQLQDLNKGIYLGELLDAEPMNFCVGIAGYPEKHFEAPNLQTDIDYLKEKVAKGAEYIVTQMFFDNKVYFDYVDRCKEAGITIPIIPGIKILTSKSQLTSLPKNFHLNIPYELSEEIKTAKKKNVLEIGTRWAAKQAEELINNNVPAVHFYVMTNSNPIINVMKKLGR
jgi:methylenetetrahydrofolate reductase (NADPH)